MPYKDPSAHKQARITMPTEDYDELVALAEAEERSVSYVAGRLIREALAKRGKRSITPLDS